MHLAINIANTYNVKLGTDWALNDVVTAVLVAAASIAGLILLFMIISGGIAMMAGGQDDPQKAAKGKSAVTSGVIGFVIIFVAYWIVRIIEIVTEVDFISNTPI